MDILLKMSFPREAIKRALFYTYNQGLEIAIKWLMDHITDYDYAEPFLPSRHDFNYGNYYSICLLVRYEIIIIRAQIFLFLIFGQFIKNVLVHNTG